MPQFIAEKTSAGVNTFQIGDELTLTTAEAKPLIADGAIRPVEVKKSPPKKAEEAESETKGK